MAWGPFRWLRAVVIVAGIEDDDDDDTETTSGDMTVDDGVWSVAVAA